MSAAQLLDVDKLSVAIGAVAIIKDLSFELRGGEILGLVGASGSGKSMTALAIMQLLPRTASQSGTVRLRGEVLTGKSAQQMREIRGRDIAMVFQQPMDALNPLMRIGDQVAETIRVHRNASRLEERNAAREMLDLVGLEGADAQDRLPYELSGGQRQRAAIAMAVIMSPALLIADEPTTALDVIAQAQILSLLKDLVRTRNMGMLFVSHDLAVISQLADRVAVMQEGRIVEQAATPELLRHARQPYTQALLAAADLKPRRKVERPKESDPILQVRGIVREYPRRRRSLWHTEIASRAVDGVSLSVHAGETVGLVGESGSGKSSLLKVVLALEQAQEGEVRLLGEQFSTARGAPLRRLRRSLQAVFQDPYGSFDPRWTVERLIAEPFYLLDSPPTPGERRRKVNAILEQVGLSAADARRLPREFSGGERQRIAIARALVTEPAVIAFDEAVSALDMLLRGQILDLLAELAERLKVAYLFVSHDLRVIRAIADHVYVMQRGRIVEEGATEAIFSAPRHAYTRALIAATPQVAFL